MLQLLSTLENILKLRVLSSGPPCDAVDVALELKAISRTCRGTTGVASSEYGWSDRCPPTAGERGARSPEVITKCLAFS